MKKFMSLITVWAMVLSLCAAMFPAVAGGVVAAAEGPDPYAPLNIGATGNANDNGSDVLNTTQVPSSSNQGKAAYVGWQNPTAPLKNVEIFSGDGASYVPLNPFDSIDLTPGGFNFFGNIGVGNSFHSAYRIDFHFVDGTVRSYYTSAQIINTAYTFDGWKEYHMFGSTAAHGLRGSVARTYVDKTQGYNGSASSLRVTNFPRTADAPDRYYSLTRNVELTEGHDYAFSARVKVDLGGAKSAKVQVDGGTLMSVDIPEAQSDEWQEITGTFHAAASGTKEARLYFAGPSNVWFDDISLKDTTAADDNNLFGDGTFEKENPGPGDVKVTELTAEQNADNTSVTLTWKHSNDYGNYHTRVYMQEEGKDEVAIGDFISHFRKTLTLWNLGAGKKYTFRVAELGNNEQYNEANSKTVEVQSVSAGSLPLRLPSNIITSHDSNTSYYLSWRNPAMESTEMHLYRVSDANFAVEAELVNEDASLAFDKRGGARNIYYETGRTTGRATLYRLDYVFEDGTKQSFYLAAQANRDFSEMYLSPADGGTVWSSHSNYGNDGSPLAQRAAAAFAHLDTTTGHNDSTSVNITSNMLRSGGNLYFQVSSQPTINLISGHDYYISAWIKANHLPDNMNIRVHFAGALAQQNYGKVYKTDGWQHFEKTVKASKDENQGGLNFAIACMTDGIWIDDVEVYDNTADSGHTKNLVSNRDFNGLARPMAETVKPTVYAAVSGDKVQLSWTTPSEPNRRGVRVYEVTGGQRNCVADLHTSGIGKVLVDAAPGEHEYVVAPFDWDMNETDSDEVSITVPGPTYMPTNVRRYDVGNTQPQDNAVKSVTWTNPTSPALKRVALYDMDQNSLLMASDDWEAAFTAEPYASQAYEQSASEAAAGLYKLVFTFDQAKDESAPAQTEFYLSGKVLEDAGRANKVPSWHPDVSNGADRNNEENFGYAYVNAVVDASPAAKDSGASLKLTSTIPEYSGNNFYRMFEGDLNALQNILQSGKKYRFTYDIKAENASRVSTHISWGKYGTFISSPINDVPLTFDWRESNPIDFTYNPGDAAIENLNICFNIEGSGIFWIDNLSLMEVGDDNQVTGSNLLAEMNSGFETGVDAAQPADVTDITSNVIQGESKGGLSWKPSADEKVTEVRLYRKDEGGDVLIGSFANEDMTVPELAAGATQYVIKTVNGNNVESAGVTFTLADKLADLVIGEVQRSEGTFTVRVDNNKMDPSVELLFIAALYDSETGELLSVASENAAVEKAQNHTYTATLDLTGKSGKVRTFLWRSGQLSPLTGSRDFTVSN